MMTWSLKKRALGFLAAISPLIGGFFGLALYKTLSGGSAVGIDWVWFPAAAVYALTAMAAGGFVLHSLISEADEEARFGPTGVLLTLVALGAANAAFLLLR